MVLSSKFANLVEMVHRNPFIFSKRRLMLFDSLILFCCMVVIHSFIPIQHPLWHLEYPKSQRHRTASELANKWRISTAENELLTNGEFKDNVTSSDAYIITKDKQGIRENTTHSDAPVCRVLSLADGKLPTSESLLPKSLFEDPQILRRLDDIYHAISHDETRLLKYMDALQRKNSNDEAEDAKLIAVLRTSLEDAGFELFSRRDCHLCEALNAGYLLRLSLLPDVSQLDPSVARDFYPRRFDSEGEPLEKNEFLFDGRVLIFWRGYASEINNDRLVLRKLDYLQTSVVQRSAAWVRMRLNDLARFVSTQFSKGNTSAKKVIRNATTSLVGRIPSKQWKSALQTKLQLTNNTDSGNIGGFQTHDDGKIFFELSRYGGSGMKIDDALGQDDTLAPFMVHKKGCAFREGSESVEQNYDESTINGRPTCLYDMEMTRLTGKPTPPMNCLERVSIRNLVDIFSKGGRRNLLSVLFSKSRLVEPTYEQVVVIWRPIPENTSQGRFNPPPVLVSNCLFSMRDTVRCSPSHSHIKV